MASTSQFQFSVGSTDKVSSNFKKGRHGKKKSHNRGKQHKEDVTDLSQDFHKDATRTEVKIITDRLEKEKKQKDAIARIYLYKDALDMMEEFLEIHDDEEDIIENEWFVEYLEKLNTEEQLNWAAMFFEDTLTLELIDNHALELGSGYYDDVYPSQETQQQAQHIISVSIPQQYQNEVEDDEREYFDDTFQEYGCAEEYDCDPDVEDFY